MTDIQKVGKEKIDIYTESREELLRKISIGLGYDRDEALRICDIIERWADDRMSKLYPLIKKQEFLLNMNHK